MRLLVLLVLAAGMPAAGDLVSDAQAAAGRQEFAAAEREIHAYRAAHGADPQVAEALSWLARGAAAAHAYTKADQYAADTRRVALELLRNRPLDSEPHLPAALGAAIEVQAQVLAARGARDEALRLLRQQLQTYWETSIRARIQKNIHLLTLEGKPAPALALTEWLGPKPVPLQRLRGKAVLLFFWAHWCSDCKAEAPILARLLQNFGPKGLVLVSPTQRYGFAAGGLDAPAAEESRYMARIWTQYYAGLHDVPVPVSAQNFQVYGSSTTPTLVLLDRSGIVRLYHPGAMGYPDLAQTVSAVLAR